MDKPAVAVLVIEPVVVMLPVAPATWKRSPLPTVRDAAGRITWQASARNKLNIFWDEQEKRDGVVGVQAAQGFRAPDGDLQVTTPINRLAQVSWTSPRTNRLLLDAGFGHHFL